MPFVDLGNNVWKYDNNGRVSKYNSLIVYESNWYN